MDTIVASLASALWLVLLLPAVLVPMFASQNLHNDSPVPTMLVVPEASTEEEDELLAA